VPKTLLQIVSQVQGELGLPQATSVIGNSDGTTTQLLNLLIGLTTDLRRMHRWTACQWEFIIEVTPALTFTGNVAANSGTITNITPTLTGTQVAAWTWQAQFPGIPTPARVTSVDSGSQLKLSLVSPTAQTGVSFIVAQDTYQIPTDFDFLTNRTMWDRTNRWELLGPDSPQMDQWHQSGVVPTGPRRHFRKLSPFSTGTFRLWPAPFEIAANLQLVFEYSSNLCVAVGGNFSAPASGGYNDPPNFSSTWTTDTDQPMLDDDLLIKGLKWKFWEAKGFNYASLKNDWIDYVDQQWGRDGARPTLNLVKRVNPIFISPANVQDGFFPGPSGPNSA
jgi:hypothetical protein